MIQIQVASFIALRYELAATTTNTAATTAYRETVRKIHNKLFTYNTHYKMKWPRPKMTNQ